MKHETRGKKNSIQKLEVILTSSPIKKTLGSADISSSSAEFSASLTVICAWLSNQQMQNLSLSTLEKRSILNYEITKTFKNGTPHPNKGEKKKDPKPHTRLEIKKSRTLNSLKITMEMKRGLCIYLFCCRWITSPCRYRRANPLPKSLHTKPKKK